ncbi:hypothetical protein [Streptomyces sp. NPDC088746]|uniref:hypothetical protein n=1 Tax=Streptomyces sp. NPDC088746 TaxID=3365885 RepID=UPI00382B619D
MTSAKSVSTTFAYDAQGNLKTVNVLAPLGTTTYTYDALGRTETVKEPRGVTVTYTYDNRERVTKIDSSNYRDGHLLVRRRRQPQAAFGQHRRHQVRLRPAPGRPCGRCKTARTPSSPNPAGNVDTYQDPAGLTDYTWNEVNKRKSLKDPKGKITS